jgi:hypothetical protein
VLLTARPLGALGAVSAVAAAVVVQNLLNQAGLRRVLGSPWPPAGFRRPYAAVVGATVVLHGVQQGARPALLWSLALAAVLSLVVVRLSRPALDVAASFPSLRRVPVLRALV